MRDTTEQLASLVILIVVFANVRAYADDGVDGVKRWWRSKLIGAPREAYA